MPYKMIVLDLDGTLLRSDKTISKETKQILTDLHHSNVIIVICTGRMPACTYGVEKELGFPTYLITLNGISIHDKICTKTTNSTRPLIYYNPLKTEYIKEIIDFGNSYNMATNYYSHDKIYSICKNESHKKLTNLYTKITGGLYEYVESYEKLFKIINPPKLLLLTGEERLDEIYEDAKEHFKGIPIKLIKADFNIEFIPQEIDKGVSIGKLCDYLNIDIMDVVAFGDGNNDSEMLSFVGLGIAMKQGSALAKKSAKKISNWTNDENAVYKEINIMRDNKLFGNNLGRNPPHRG